MMENRVNSIGKNHTAQFSAKIMLFGIVMLMLISFVSALEWDNKQNVLERYGKAGYRDIEIKNSLFLGLGTGETLWSGTLEYNTNICGEFCNATQTIILHEKGSLVDEVIFKELQEDGSWIEKDIRSYKIYANNNPYILGTEMETGIYEVKLEGRKNPKLTVDWIYIVQGEELLEWADWGGGTLVNNLSAYYKFDELSGNTVLKDELFSNNITLNNSAPSGFVGQINNALNFTDRDFIGTGMPQLGVNGSIGFWMRDVNITNNWIMGSQEGGLQENEWALLVDGTSGGKLLFITENSSGQVSITSNDSLADGNWHNVVTTWNSSDMRMYVDGTLQTDIGVPASIPKITNAYIGAARRAAGIIPYDGELDELGIWNRTLLPSEVTELYASGIGFSYPFGDGVITLNSPINNFETTDNEIEFNCSFVITGGDEAVNISLYHNATGVWHKNETKSITGTSNETTFNKTFNSGDKFIWTCNVNDDGGGIGFGNNRTAEIVKVSYNSTTFNNITFSGESESFILNFTLGSGVTISDAVLNYNNTNFTSTILSLGNSFQLRNTINVPIINTDTNFSFNFLLTLDGETFQSPIFEQQAVELSMTNCSTGGSLILNMSLFDERLKTNITGDIEVNVQAISKLSLEQTGDTNLSFDDVHSGTVCLSPLSALPSLYLDAEIRYTSENYATELYHIQRADLSDAPINLSLFSLLSNESTEFLVTYQDDDLILVTDAILQLQRKYISEDLYEVVEAPLTSDGGTAVVHVDLNTNKYRITVVKNGEVLDFFDNIVFNCESELSGQCTHELLGTIDPQNDVSVETLTDFSYTISDIVNDTITVSFSIPSGTPSNVNVFLNQRDQFNNSFPCNNTVFSSAGSVNCEITTTIGDSFLELTIKKADELQAQKGYIIQEDSGLDFALNNYFILFILMLSVIGMAFTSPEWIIINAVMTMVIAGVLYLANGLNFVVGLGNLIWLIVAAVIIIFKLSHQEDK